MIEHPRKPDVPRPPDSPDIIDGEPSDLNPAPPPDIPPQPLPARSSSGHPGAQMSLDKSGGIDQIGRGAGGAHDLQSCR